MSIWESKRPLADPKKIRALALDLDGTILAPGAVLSERTVKTVKLCMLRNIRIIIVTGRAIEGAERFRAALGAEGPMVYYNGAVVADMPENKILNTTLLDINAAEFCVDLARDMGVYCQVYLPCENFSEGNSGGGQIRLLAELDSPERGMYHKHTGILSELVDLKEALKMRNSSAALPGCVKTMFLAEPEVLSALRLKLEEHFRGSTYIAQTLRTFLEVMDAKTSKGHGLKFVMERCSLKKEEVIAFGDEESDLLMFDAAGFSAAPSNAKDKVKARADIVTASNAEDGAAAFLEEYFDL